ncbi:hypothetical protein COO91_07073 [Nostoc flagelliforme CCNUN1]|uniref:Uncharacterized protein n=1 Tax=Nostoc flagelliforme CCNUN1 TaxID=2038116 RepID=A0A2K8T209_9NOSO|nr:hypothetical protein COO91_07073 [Nostoc flagelliforme CCNUN1]
MWIINYELGIKNYELACIKIKIKLLHKNNVINAFGFILKI